jgi:hypothetical protein
MRRETVFNRVWTRFVCETAFQRIDFAFRVYMGGGHRRFYGKNSDMGTDQM